MNFLPSDYQAPKSNSGYMRFQDGENRFRIISLAIFGWEDWKDDKPIRFRYNAKPEKSVNPLKPFRHFWAFIVWNYADAKIQILEIVQASIRKRLEELSKDVKWGQPYGYDIRVLKQGEAVETKYMVLPCTPQEIDPHIRSEFYKLPLDLEELFRAGDPFQAVGDSRTKAFWETNIVTENAIIEETITFEQEQEIERVIDKDISP